MRMRRSPAKRSSCNPACYPACAAHAQGSFTAYPEGLRRVGALGRWAPESGSKERYGANPRNMAPPMKFPIETYHVKRTRTCFGKEGGGRRGVKPVLKGGCRNEVGRR